MEIGTDKDRVHFLVQSVPTYSITKIVTIIKSITAKEIFREDVVTLKSSYGGGEFWTDGYLADSIGKYENEEMISNYVKRIM